MSKDTITVSMNVYDIPIVVEALEEANKEIERLNNIIKEVRELLSKYNDNESNYYVPVDITLKILDKENKE